MCGVCVGGGGRAFYTYIYSQKGRPCEGAELVKFWLQKPSILRACVREEDTGGREEGAQSTTPTYTVRRDGPESDNGDPIYGINRR